MYKREIRNDPTNFYRMFCEDCHKGGYLLINRYSDNIKCFDCISILKEEKEKEKEVERVKLFGEKYDE
jgi:hypothetical protein